MTLILAPIYTVVICSHDVCKLPASTEHTKVPAVLLTAKQIKALLYRRGLQKKSGGTATQAAVETPPQHLALQNAKKRAALADERSADPVQVMMLAHFREVMNPGAFYSLPLSIFEEVGLQLLMTALGTSSTDTLLPISGPQTLLNRCTGSAAAAPEYVAPAAIEGVQLLAIAHPDDEEYPRRQQEPDQGALVAAVAHVPPVGSAPGTAAETQLLLNMLNEANNYGNEAEIIVFRVTDSRPHLKKRPHGFSDNVNNQDFSIRLYRLVKLVSDDDVDDSEAGLILSVTECKHTDIPLVRLFGQTSNSRTSDITENMKQWTTLPGIEPLFEEPQHSPALTDDEREMLQDVVKAKALTGSSVTYATDGLSLEEDEVVETLVRYGLLVRGGGSQSTHVQAQARLLSCAIRIGKPKSAFSIRPGVPFAFKHISKAVKPTLFEVFLKLSQSGWRDGTENLQDRELKPSAIKKKYYQASGAVRDANFSGTTFFPPLRYWYGVCLLNAASMGDNVKIYHGQLEAYYTAVLNVNDQQAEVEVPPNKPCQFTSSCVTKYLEKNALGVQALLYLFWFRLKMTLMLRPGWILNF